jgi:hypothetical protein
MSDVEKYWEAIRAKWGGNVPTWNKLEPMDQIRVLQSINEMLQVLNRYG